MARLATQAMLGKKISEMNLKSKEFAHFGVKEAVFPFDMFQEVDPLLGPEMRSTGEVLGLADSFGLAFYKAQVAAKQKLPCQGGVLITVTDQDKPEALSVARSFHKMGFTIMTTKGTHEFFAKEEIPSKLVLKMHEGRPGIVDEIKNGNIHLVINTPIGKLSKFQDSYIRKAAIKYKIPYITTMAAARAVVKGISARLLGQSAPQSVQEYHAEIK
jgi:carbamoyl-phosphate synthase large subunit